MSIFRSLVVGALFGLSGCDLPDPPVVEDRTAAPWAPGVSRDFLMTVEASPATLVEAVRLRFTRHLWPGFDKANVASVDEDGSVEGGWKASGAGLAGAPASHHLFYQWEVDYTFFGFGGGTVVSPVLDFVIGCTPEATNDDLLSAQMSVVASHDTPTPHLSGTLTGYSVQPHGFASIRNNGVGFASPVGGLVGLAPGMALSTELGQPALILYKPRDPNPGESAEDHFKTVTNHSKPAGPYELVGWAYGAPYDPTVRPVMGCIPSSAWFLHEAGYHLIDGSMALYSVSEGVVGAATVGGMLPPPDAPPPGDALFWHPRIWDLHMWRAEDGAPPRLAISRPEGVTGIDDAGLFVRPQTFE